MSGAQDRWLAAADRVHPQLTRSVSWPPLHAALDRAAAAGVDVDQLLSRLADEQPPGGADPAGDLLWRLYDQCPEAAPSLEELPDVVEPASSAGRRDSAGIIHPAPEPQPARQAPAAGISI